MPNRLPSKQALVLFIILGIAAAIGLGAYFLQSTAQQILIVQSERTAFAWARYLAAELPRIEAVAEGAELTPEEERFLNGVRKFGNIFRFKLFDRNGNLRLVSDDLRTNYSKTAGGTPDHSATSRIVVATGRPVTELQDGTEKPDRPDTYSETYIPVYRDNTLVAVSEVYIDKTQLASDVMRDFLAFGLRVAGALLLGIIVPVVTLVYLVQLMRRQNRKLEDGERFRSNFFAHMNHELRTPLNSIIGFSDVMANERYGRIGNERYAGYVKDIHFSGMHLLSLINDVLDMSKIEAGQLTVEDEVFPLSDLMHETVTLLAQQADAKAITVGIEYEADAAYLRADPQLCKQVFLNLLDNAIKFSHVGGAITVGFGTADHGGAVVTIADTGVGIAEADIDRVVEPFIQSRHDVTVAHHGTGLGLTLCDNIMKLHGGTLKMESELNKGTLVTVSFPPDRTIMPMQKRAIAAV